MRKRGRCIFQICVLAQQVRDPTRFILWPTLQLSPRNDIFGRRPSLPRPSAVALFAARRRIAPREYALCVRSLLVGPRCRLLALAFV